MMSVSAITAQGEEEGGHVVLAFIFPRPEIPHFAFPAHAAFVFLIKLSVRFTIFLLFSPHPARVSEKLDGCLTAGWGQPTTLIL